MKQPTLLATFIGIYLTLAQPLTLTLDKAYNSIYFLLFLLSVWFLIKSKNTLLTPKKGYPIKLFLSALTLYTVPFLLGALKNSPLNSIEKPLIFFTALPIGLFISQLQLKNLKYRQLIIRLTYFSIVPIFLTVLFQSDFFNDYRSTAGSINPVAYGYALTSFFTLLLFLPTFSKADLVLKFGSTLLTYFLILETGTRMALIAAIFSFFAVATLNQNPKVKLKSKILSVLFVLAAAAGLTAVNPTFAQKIKQTTTSITQAKKGNLSSSLGSRFDLWAAAVRIGKANLIFGAGSKNHMKEKSTLIEQGKNGNHIDQYVQYHNSVLDSFAKRGLPGAFGTLMLLLLPILYYLKQRLLNKKIPNMAYYSFCCTLFVVLFLYSLTDSVLISNYVTRISLLTLFTGQLLLKG